jgi:predicted Zn-dependent protease
LRLVVSDGKRIRDDRVAADDHLPGSSPPATRLTQRGRLAMALLTMVAMATLAVLLANSVDAAAPQIDHATTVVAGQTLSEIAAAQLPGLPIRDAVAQIQLANALSSSQVHAGQSLQIPVMP